MNKGIAVLDGKAFLGAGVTASASVVSWIDTANLYGQFVLTVIGIVVGLATLWYTVERAKRLRRARLDRDE